MSRTKEISKDLSRRVYVFAVRVAGGHLFYALRSGDRPFPRRHLFIPAKRQASGALPRRAAEAAAGVAHGSAALQPRDLPLADEPGRVPIHRAAGRLLHHHVRFLAEPLPARLAPLTAA